MRRAWLIVACVASIFLAGAPVPAQGAGGLPLFTFVPTLSTQPKVQPAGYLAGPCGLGVDSSGRLYVSDYYHHTVDLFNVNGGTVTYASQLAKVDPLDGPCGLALDGSNDLYVNDFDRNVLRFGAYPSFGSGSVLAGAGVDDSHPTGVAVDPITGNVYVDERTYIAGYDSSGAQLMDGGSPLKIGLGTLGEGYGLAVDNSGRFYVADASTDTVKVYVPAISKTSPQLTIAGPSSGFTSLRHAALAVDWSKTGSLYVIDDLQPSHTEQPAGQVDVFNSLSGSYLGVLKYLVIDARPAGIAVDNSSTSANQGNVYVTSGNTDQAGIYGYGPGSQVASSSPPIAGLVVNVTGSGGGMVSSSLGGLDCASSCSMPIRAGAQVTLSATPEPGSHFAGWYGGDCDGGGECTVRMEQASAIGASFEADKSPQSNQGAAPDTVVFPDMLTVRVPANAANRRPQFHRRHRLHHRLQKRRQKWTSRSHR